MSRGWQAQRRQRAAIRAVLLGGAVVVVLVPLAWTVLAAVGIAPNNNTSPPSWVAAPSLDHLADVSVVEPAFWQELATSVGVSAVAAVLATVLSFLAAYGIARSMSPARRRLSPALLVLASLPVMAYALPLSDLLRRAGFLDSLPGLTLCRGSGNSTACCLRTRCPLGGGYPRHGRGREARGGRAREPFAKRGPASRSPDRRGDRHRPVRSRLNMPLLPLVLTGIDVRTLPVILTDFFTLEREVDWPTAAAALTISLVPLSSSLNFPPLARALQPRRRRDRTDLDPARAWRT